jgi:RNA polymerase-associated protein CTR9
MHLTKEEWQPAQKKFERILEKDKSDAYSLLALGNIYYHAKFHNPEKEQKYLKLAYDFFWKVLTKSPANIYAANGVGITTAERGNFVVQNN